MRRSFIVSSSPGVQISVHDLGGSGPALFFLPANGFHGLCYEPIASRLQSYFHSYGIDLRGQGDSPMSLPSSLAEQLMPPLEEVLQPSSSFPTLEGYIADVMAAADYLGLKEVYLFGHSAGGAAAVGAAQTRPSLIKGLFLYEPIMRSIEERKLQEAGLSLNRNHEILRAKALKRRSVYHSKADALQSYSKRGFQSFHPAALRAYVEHGFKELPGQEGCALKCDVVGEAMVYMNIMRMGDPFWPGLASLACPVTIGVGEAEAAGLPFSAQMAGDVMAGCKHARLRRYPELGHFGPFEDPKLLSRELVASFLSPMQGSVPSSKL